MEKIKIKTVHYISGITISLFTGLHLVNHTAAMMGAGTHIKLMENFRLVYRNPVVESILLFAVLIQIISGIKLIFRQEKKSGLSFQKLQIFSGLYLAVFFTIHVGAVMMGRFVLGLDTNYYFGAAGINSYPFSLFFIPYYSLAILSFFAHIASVHHSRMTVSIIGIPVKQQSIGILFLGLFVALTVMYSMTGKFSGVEIPKEFQVLIGK